MHHNARLIASLSLAAVAAAALAGCAADEAEQPSSGAPTSAQDDSASPGGEGTAEPDDPDEGGAAFAMPKVCSDVYGADLFEALSGPDGFGPLNDPGMTLLSTQVVGALELLDGTDALRCSWGLPSEVGVATTVAAIDDATAQRLREALDAEGTFECDDAEPTTCTYAQTLNGDESQSSSTETHVFGEGGWVATTELNTSLEPGYSEDVRATLWK